MNVTQCSGGRVAMELYETGRQLQEAGVICGHDITTEAAVAKLMYVLGQNLPRRTDAATSATRFARRIYRCRHCINRIFFSIFRTV